MKYTYLAILAAFFLINSAIAYAAICPFDSGKSCTLQRDILNDKGANGLRYYAPTNYDHRMSGEIQLYKSNLVVPYSDSFNKPGQIALLMQKGSPYIAGEIMTRANLHLAPFYSPVQSNRWTTQELNHGYLEVVVKMPKCDTSMDGRCNNGTAPNEYTRGLWPAIWLMPTMDANWPLNGELDISEAYLNNTAFNVSTAAFHFNGNSSQCWGNDCVYAGYGLPNITTAQPLWTQFHTWGFEWEPDPVSASGGLIMNGYFDNRKVWGPIRSDTLPADGANAFRRAFNDPNGGWYLIINLAVGGGYAGAPNPQMLTSTMYIQSVKAYSVMKSSSPTVSCLPPSNIQSMVSADKKQVTIAWMPPPGNFTISRYQVSDWQHRNIWQGNEAKTRVYQDQSLPGTNGNFVYYLSTVCSTGPSAEAKYTVTIQ